MSNKTKNMIISAVALANISAPITGLAHNNTEELNSINNLSNTDILSRKARLLGNTIANTDVNLRSTASWSGNIIQVIKKGEPVFVTSVSGDWAKVSHDNQTGYVACNYLDATTNNKTVSEDVNLRQTASWSGNKLNIIKEGESFNLVSISGEWAKVQFEGLTGYIPSKYIKDLNNSINDSVNNKTVTEAVNLRETASWSGNIIHTIKKGETVNVISTSGDFSKVSHNGKTGFIPTKYVSGANTSTTNNKTVTEAVNLRETASWSGNIIHTIKKGETVNVISTSGDFSKVSHNGKTGYIPTKYVGQSSSSNNSNSSNNSGTTSTPSTNVNIESMNKIGKVINLKSGETLNIRSGTNTSTTSLGKLTAGASVQITGRDKETGWYQIDYNGKVGYVGDYYIQIVEQTTPSTPATTYKKTTANLNMRSSATTSASLIMTIPKDSVVAVLSSSNGWDYVEYQGKRGFCSSSYLTANATVTRYTTTNVNMRTGPSTSHSIITTLDTNVAVEVLSKDANGWAKIKYNGKEGYVNAQYLRESAGSSDLPSSNPSYSRVKVVIDPGHGGKDPGAIGFGRNEKDIALSISKKINANLKTLGFKTVMTRSTDVYIPLAERYQIANNNNANLFVSVHLNAASSSADGIETLYRDSKSFAQDIQSEMISATGARNRGIKRRTDLAVLNGTKMSATLVETGFISNSDESAKLATDSYQNTLAASIAKGIASYTDKNL